MRPLLPKRNRADSGNDSVSDTPPLHRALDQQSEFRIPAVPGPSDSGGARAKPKRIVVSNACVPCRKRRSKCDGALPCAKCKSLDRAGDCQFDAENDHRRKGALRRENETLKRKNSVLNEELKRKNAHLFRILANSEDAELENIVKRIRRGEKFGDIANEIRSAVSNPGGSAAADDSGDSGGDYLDRSSPSNDEGGLEELDSGAERSDGQSLQVPYVRPSSWTNITNDDSFVIELIELYFTWHHPFFLLFSEQRFRADFATGRLANCSSLLVNAILATGCSYSDRPEALEDPNNPDTVGEHFGKESKRIFERGGKRTITTIQALPVMAIREAGVARDLMGRWYLSLAYRLVCDSSYNEILVPQQMQKNDIDEEAWRITFWGCYNLETMWNFGLGRPNEDNRLAEHVPKPTPTDETEKALWYPYTGYTPKSALQSGGECMMYEIFNQLAGLCQITQGITSWLYGKKLFKAGTLLEYHTKLKAWRDNLPERLKIVKCGDLPILFYLHGFHRTIVLALFRPFVALPFEPGQNFLSPRLLTDMHARELVQIMRMFHSSWGFRHSNGMVYQFLIPMCSARQLEFPSPQARADYQFGVFGMKEAGFGWPFGKIALLSMAEIKDLSEEKKKPTEELEQMLNEFQVLSVEKKTEMTHNSDYYAKIVENDFGGLEPDFIHHWTLEWAKFIVGSVGSGSVMEKAPTIVKKLSVRSLLN